MMTEKWRESGQNCLDSQNLSNLLTQLGLSAEVSDVLGILEGWWRDHYDKGANDDQEGKDGVVDCDDLAACLEAHAAEEWVDFHHFELFDILGKKTRVCAQ